MQDRDHLQAAVDALRTDAAKGEIAGVEVVRTLARRAFHVDIDRHDHCRYTNTGEDIIAVNVSVQIPMGAVRQVWLI